MGMVHKLRSGSMRPLARSLDACGLGVCCIAVLSIHLCWRVPAQTRAEYATSRIQRAMTVRENHDAIVNGYREQRSLLDTLEAEATALQRRVPATLAESGFLAEFSRLADEHELAVNGFQPGTPLEWGNCRGMEIQISVRSQYKNLCRFLDALNRLEQLSRITDLRVSGASQQTGLQDVQMTIVLFGQRSRGERGG